MQIVSAMTKKIKIIIALCNDYVKQMATSFKYTFVCCLNMVNYGEMCLLILPAYAFKKGLANV
jgi:hypothetical protein